MFCSIEKVATFRELGDVFIGAVFQGGTLFKRTDVVFDRYYEKSIKEGSRARHGQVSVAVRGLIKSRNVPLPVKWDAYMAHTENEAELPISPHNN